MKVIDCHFHWWPPAYVDHLLKRRRHPLAERHGRGGFVYTRTAGAAPECFGSAIWFDLDRELELYDRLGHDVSVVSSIGPVSVHFSDLPPAEGRELAMLWNEEMARAQTQRRGRFWGTAAIPLVDTQIALDVLEHAIERLGLVGINIPGSIGGDPRIDAPRLEPFYARVAELGVPVFLHPTDAVFPSAMEGYDGALYLSLGRVVDVSTSGARLVLSGLMERHPALKVYISHTGGALPYQSGRMDKNSGKANLPHPPSRYLKRMVTDTTSPHALGVKFAIEYYGIDNVMYGSDYPCWEPEEAIRIVEQLQLAPAHLQKVFYSNAVRLFGLNGAGVDLRGRPKAFEPTE